MSGRETIKKGNEKTLTVSNRLVTPNLLIMIGVDAFLVTLSFFGSYLLRFEFNLPQHEWVIFTQTLPFVLMVKMGTFAFFHLYRGMWRYTSLLDLFKVVKAVLTSSLLIVLTLFMVNRLVGTRGRFFWLTGF